MQRKLDCSLVQSVPLHIFWKRKEVVPTVAQHALSKEAKEGKKKKKKRIESIIKLGVLMFTSSFCNASILSVRKEGIFDSDGNQIIDFYKM